MITIIPVLSKERLDPCRDGGLEPALDPVLDPGLDPPGVKVDLVNIDITIKQ